MSASGLDFLIHLTTALYCVNAIFVVPFHLTSTAFSITFLLCSNNQSHKRPGSCVGTNQVISLYKYEQELARLQVKKKKKKKPQSFSNTNYLIVTQLRAI